MAHVPHVTTIALCLYSKKEEPPIYDVKVNEHGYVPIKLYLQKHGRLGWTHKM